VMSLRTCQFSTEECYRFVFLGYHGSYMPFEASV
jgi:hypothetical protein